MIDKTARILVVGGSGTMGSSTALELARKGYSNIHVLDMFTWPSNNSAGNDMNKLISTQYVEGIWGRLAFETWDAWNHDTLFRPYLHPTGRVDLAGPDNPSRVASLKSQYQLSVESGRADNVEWLDDEEAILKKAPYLGKADITGWRGLWVKDAGWMAARDAIRAVGVELERLGVRGTFGDAGTFHSLLLGEDGSCVGVTAVDGTDHRADVVILATGAWTPTLLDLQNQCESKCWQYGHIQLSAEETKDLEGSAPMYNSGLGFFMEPSPDGVMKIVNEFEGYTRMTECRPFGSETDLTMSVPRSHALNPTDTIPTEGSQAIQKVIDTCLPDFSGRPLFDTALCWCTDSFDGNWLLCKDPRYRNLILATGDSGHTFKMLPIVGKYVVGLLEDTVGPHTGSADQELSVEDEDLWSWRPERNVAGTVAREGSKSKDLRDVGGWRHDSIA